ncbi:hypothetical protein, partial [Candidatus Entotheonella palauensis]|uniref:hypothetical protein n=1 Tax=Candidatus Entotheonella palauensis TaxID=93172 RepID=UPI001C4DE643
ILGLPNWARRPKTFHCQVHIMPAVAEDIVIIEPIDVAAAEQTPIITTLYDLIAALQEQVAPEEDNIVTSAVVDLCKTRHLHFLNLPNDHGVICN